MFLIFLAGPLRNAVLVEFKALFLSFKNSTDVYYRIFILYTFLYDD